VGGNSGPCVALNVGVENRNDPVKSLYIPCSEVKYVLLSKNHAVVV